MKYWPSTQRLTTSIRSMALRISAEGSAQNGVAARTDTGAREAAYLADFLTGARSSYQLNNFVIVNYHQYMNFFYAQDDFRLTPKLTINAGLRYELVTPQFVDGNHLANFDPATNTLIQASGGSLYNRALVHTPKLDFAPRFGIAYQTRPEDGDPFGLRPELRPVQPRRRRKSAGI